MGDRMSGDTGGSEEDINLEQHKRCIFHPIASSDGVNAYAALGEGDAGMTATGPLAAPSDTIIAGREEIYSGGKRKLRQRLWEAADWAWRGVAFRNRCPRTLHQKTQRAGRQHARHCVADPPCVCPESLLPPSTLPTSLFLLCSYASRNSLKALAFRTCLTDASSYLPAPDLLCSSLFRPRLIGL